MLNAPRLFDLADLRGVFYYSGIRFAMLVPGGSDALVRGEGTMEVGSVFGRIARRRLQPDVKQIACVTPDRDLVPPLEPLWLRCCCE